MIMFNGNRKKFQIEKIHESSFHVWKREVEPGFAFCELIDHISSEQAPLDTH